MCTVGYDLVVFSEVNLAMSIDIDATHIFERVVTASPPPADAKISAPFSPCVARLVLKKMHNDNKYVLFLDDDVRLHLGTVEALTKEMEKNPEIFIQTGYPLDLPSGSLGSYCIYEYHMEGVFVVDEEDDDDDDGDPRSWFPWSNLEIMNSFLHHTLRCRGRR